MLDISKSYCAYSILSKTSDVKEIFILKKILSILLCLCLIFPLAACGQDGTNGNNNNKENVSTDNKTENKSDADDSGNNDDEESKIIRENGKLPNNDKDLTEAEKLHYLTIVMQAAIDLDIETLKIYAKDQEEIDYYQAIIDDPEYKWLYENTIGNIKILPESGYMVAKSTRHIFVNWYTDMWRQGAKIPEDVDKFSFEEIKSLYAKYYNDAVYVINDIYTNSYDTYLKNGYIYFEIDELFRDAGYGDVQYTLSPSHHTYNGASNNYAHYLFGTEGTTLDLGYDYIDSKKDEKFPIWSIMMEADLDKVVEYFESHGVYDINDVNESDSELYTNTYKLYYKDELMRAKVQEWTDKNVQFKRDLSTIVTFIRANVDVSSPYYTLTKEEKDSIRDLPLYIVDMTFASTKLDIDEFDVYYSIINEMVEAGYIEKLH